MEEVCDNIWYKNATSTFNRPISDKNTEQETSTRNIHLSKNPACHSFEGASNILFIIKNNVMPQLWYNTLKCLPFKTIFRTIDRLILQQSRVWGPTPAKHRFGVRVWKLLKLPTRILWQKGRPVSAKMSFSGILEAIFKSFLFGISDALPLW